MKFETGATTHTVNDLILWIENDQRSFEQIENVYKDNQRHKFNSFGAINFNIAVNEGISNYKLQFPTSCDHVKEMTYQELAELCRYFAKGYTNWSDENNYLSSVEVIFEDAVNNYTTSMSKKTTEADAKEYFIGRSFNVGSYPVEDFQKVIAINYTAPTYATV